MPHTACGLCLCLCFFVGRRGCWTAGHSTVVQLLALEGFGTRRHTPPASAPLLDAITAHTSHLTPHTSHPTLSPSLPLSHTRTHSHTHLTRSLPAGLDVTHRLRARRFRGGLVFKAHRLCVSLNSRLESNKEEGLDVTHRLRTRTGLMPSRPWCFVFDRFYYYFLLIVCLFVCLCVCLFVCVCVVGRRGCWTEGCSTVDSSCRLLIVPLFLGSSRFESLQHISQPDGDRGRLPCT